MTVRLALGLPVALLIGFLVPQVAGQNLVARTSLLDLVTSPTPAVALGVGSVLVALILIVQTALSRGLLSVICGLQIRMSACALCVLCGLGARSLITIRGLRFSEAFSYGLYTAAACFAVLVLLGASGNDEDDGQDGISEETEDMTDITGLKTSLLS